MTLGQKTMILVLFDRNKENPTNINILSEWNTPKLQILEAQRSYFWTMALKSWNKKFTTPYEHNKKY